MARKVRQGHRVRQALLKSNADLKDLVRVLKKAKFKGISQKGRSGRKNDNRNAGESSHVSAETDLMAYKERFYGTYPDGTTEVDNL